MAEKFLDVVGAVGDDWSDREPDALCRCDHELQEHGPYGGACTRCPCEAFGTIGPIPKYIREMTIETLGDPLTIKEADETGDKLGYFDERNGEIRVNKNQPWVGKNIVLLHELLHVVDIMLVQSGAKKRRMNHGELHNLAPNLLAVLVAAGLWKLDVTMEEVTEFWEAQEPEE